MEDQLPNATLFCIDLDWYGKIKDYLEKGYFEKDISKEESKHITIKSQLYTLNDDTPCKMGLDGVLCKCLMVGKT